MQGHSFIFLMQRLLAGPRAWFGRRYSAREVFVLDGTAYPVPHPDYADCAEELFHYTSRYYGYTEQRLRTLARRPVFTMAGYNASRLSAAQRRVLAGLMAEPASRRLSRAIIDIVEANRRGSVFVDEALLHHYCARAPHPHESGCGKSRSGQPGGVRAVEPLDPLLHFAQRYRVPVQVRGREVRVSMRSLRPFLDARDPAVREAIRRCIGELHRGGYVLRNRAPGTPPALSG